MTIGIEWGPTEEAVEALARGLYKTDFRHAFAAWDDTYEDIREQYRVKARTLMSYLTERERP